MSVLGFRARDSLSLVIAAAATEDHGCSNCMVTTAIANTAKPMGAAATTSFRNVATQHPDYYQN